MAADQFRLILDALEIPALAWQTSRTHLSSKSFCSSSPATGPRAARPQRPHQPVHNITALRQVAQHQPSMDEIVARRRDRIGGDVVTGYLELGQLGSRDEPGVDAGSENAFRRPVPCSR